MDTTRENWQEAEEEPEQEWWEDEEDQEGMQVGSARDSEDEGEGEEREVELSSLVYQISMLAVDHGGAASSCAPPAIKAGHVQVSNIPSN
ncbi:hypothetical protein C8R43DRAFT_1116184 [Mycena crocata]|nr:hypothetical protein C8R43DRAFT_1116184 [Mycena crocata]